MSQWRRHATQSKCVRPTTLSFAEPILSITFDDFPASAAEAGARILESHGARGTYYAAAALAAKEGPCGRNFSAADLNRLAAAGHEIGCHTHDHGDCAQRGVFDTLRDFAKNRDALADMGLATPQTALAYPYGETRVALKESLPPRFATARGVLPGLNHGRVDLTQLHAYPLFGAGAIGRVRAALKRAAKRKAWLIAFTHDVAENPSRWGTRERHLDALLQLARKLRVTVLPVSAAFARATQ